MTTRVNHFLVESLGSGRNEITECLHDGQELVQRVHGEGVLMNERLKSLRWTRTAVVRSEEIVAVLYPVAAFRDSRVFRQAGRPGRDVVHGPMRELGRDIVKNDD